RRVVGGAERGHRRLFAASWICKVTTKITSSICSFGQILILMDLIDSYLALFFHQGCEDALMIFGQRLRTSSRLWVTIMEGSRRMIMNLLLAKTDLKQVKKKWKGWRRRKKKQS
ncbi:hypothetical protein LINPERPRIM_LOCUS41389, partial [Linum perenne]